MLLDRIPFLFSLLFCMWSKYFGGDVHSLHERSHRAQASPTKHVQGWHHISRRSKNNNNNNLKKKTKNRPICCCCFSCDFWLGRKKKKRQVAVWSVRFIYMRNKNQSLSSIYSCCDINDAMHYSHSLQVCIWGEMVVLTHIQSAADVCQYLKLK